MSEETENLYCSWVHWPPCDRPIPATSDFTQAAGLAVASALSETLNLPVFIKPINDIYAPLPNHPNPGGEMGGILVETIVQGGVVLGLVTGLGLNRVPVVDSDGVLTGPAVSLAELFPKSEALPSKEALVQAIHECLQPLYQRLFEGHPLPMAQLMAPYALPT